MRFLWMLHLVLVPGFFSGRNHAQATNTVSNTAFSPTISIQRQNTILGGRNRRPNSGGNAAALVCKALPNPNRDQLELCAKYPDVTASAMQGLRIAVHECQFQFRKNRWNCSTLENGKNYRNLHSSIIMSRGYRESAFIHALTSAGVAHAVAKACSMGKLMSCGCGKTSLGRTKSWRWSGCNHNMDFGVHFSKLLLDSREKAKDIHSKINMHNNQVGRQMVSRNMEIKCKCHGMSGSCEMKTDCRNTGSQFYKLFNCCSHTDFHRNNIGVRMRRAVEDIEESTPRCWKAAVNFRRVGSALKDRYRNAMLVDHTNNGYGPLLRPALPGTKKTKRRQRRRKKSQLMETDLVYIERSPNFCEPDATEESLGTRGRMCNKTSPDSDNCDFLCCGRGYNTIRQRRIERCQCRFKWCCHVVCKECVYEEWVTVCK